MEEDAHAVRLRLLEIIGAVGEVREHAASFELADVRYFEREQEKVQGGAHRLLEILDAIEQRRY